jgi:hypothetical protein
MGKPLDGHTIYKSYRSTMDPMIIFYVYTSWWTLYIWLLKTFIKKVMGLIKDVFTFIHIIN